MIPIKGVLFDLDGTLMDTAPDFYRTMDIIRERYRLPSLSESIVRNHVSDGSRALTQLCFAHEALDTHQFEERRLELLDVYADIAGNDAKVFVEMEQILNALDANNVPWGIVTNKPRLYTELILERTKLNLNCRVLVCADDLNNAKPDPEGIFFAAKELNLNPAEVLYVGDHERDVVAGKRAGSPTAVVTFGYFDEHSDIHSWDANFIFNSLDDFLAQIEFK
jgi:N-acetyl-D-muramate 6-phosphate phosphatase